MKIYLVGGAVRDELMGLCPKDRDYVVVGATAEQMLSLGFEQVGASFPVFLKNGEEYALARTERKDGVGYNGFAVEFDPSITLEQDLIRRDLTINAMAKDLETGEIIDPYGGQHDLADKVLRHTSEAFAEDPVRVLRVARFAARYTDFTVARETMLLMRKVVHELDYVPAERVFAEFHKGMSEQSPYRMIQVLREVFDEHHRVPTALKPYMKIGLARSLDCVRPYDTMTTRMVLLLSSFNRDNYVQHKIPVEYSRVARALHSRFESWYNFDQLLPERQVELLTDVRAFSDPTLVNHVGQALEVYERLARRPASVWSAISKCLSAASSINAAEIAEKGGNIKQAIFEARVAAVKKMVP